VERLEQELKPSKHRAPHRTGPMETASGSGRRKGSNDGNGGGGED
jgi:hypothetical protein